MNADLSRFIDHTQLKPEATIEQIMKLCEEAIKYKFAAVCVNPCYVDLATHRLSGTGVMTATVIGFPLGATFLESKVYEALAAVRAKADELDMVINIGALKAQQWDYVSREIKAVVGIAEGKTVKVIVETALLSEEEKRRICEVVLKSGANFIKTSTGFVPNGGANIEDIKLFKSIIGDTAICGIKASGGIRTEQQFLSMINAGATRVGTSSGVAIIKGLSQQ